MKLLSLSQFYAPESKQNIDNLPGEDGTRLISKSSHKRKNKVLPSSLLASTHYTVQ